MNQRLVVSSAVVLAITAISPASVGVDWTTSTSPTVPAEAGVLGSDTANTQRPGGRATAVRIHGREVDFTEDWRFVLVNSTGITDPFGEYENAPDPAYDDSAWRALDLPHDWSIELLPTTGPGTGTSDGTGYLQGGLGWYRKTFTLPRSTAGKRISIEFDGVYMDSYVYFNGVLVGNHPYGYTGFSFDLTDLAHTDGVTPNVIAVRVQNRLPSSRWYSGSGIYRDVRLVVTDPVHVARLGTFVSTPDLETTLASGFANVRVETDLANDTGDSKKVTVVSTVLDAKGTPVKSAKSTVDVGADGASAVADIEVRQPRLWTFDDPYRYTLRTELVVGREVSRHGDDAVRHPLLRDRPGRGVLAQRCAGQDPGRRPAPRSRRTGRRDQPGRARSSDVDHEEHGRQRAPHGAQPSGTRARRGLRGARHRDDGRGVRHVVEPEDDVRLRPVLQRVGGRPTSARWSTPTRTRRP